MAFPRAFQTYIPRSHCINTHVYGAILLNKFSETVVIKGRQTELWSFPKGHGEYRELPLEACMRELREETGIDLKGSQPDDEIRFRSGTYFVFFVNERINLVPQDTNEVMEAMWTPITRLPYLSGNKDMRSFCKCINITNILDKMALKAAA